MANSPTYVENFLKGVSRGLFLFFLLFGPLFIEDELRRLPKSLTVGKIFLPCLAAVKILYAALHFLFQANSKEITKLLMSMIILSGVVLYSDATSPVTFQDIYLTNTIANEQSTSANTNIPDDYYWSLAASYMPFSLPPLLDNTAKGSGITAAVAELQISSPQMIAYQWITIIGVVASIAVHCVSFKDITRIGSIGLGLFYLLFGFGLVGLNEIQRPCLKTLIKYKVINRATMDDKTVANILLIFAFVIAASGASILQRNRNIKKFGILFSIGTIVSVLMFEIQNMQTSQRMKQLNKITPIQGDMKTMLKYHEKFIFPMDFALLRIINLMMILSGTLFQMIKIYNPASAFGQTMQVIIDDAAQEIRNDAVTNFKDSVHKKNKKNSKQKESKKTK